MKKKYYINILFIIIMLSYALATRNRKNLHRSLLNCYTDSNKTFEFSINTTVKGTTPSTVGFPKKFIIKYLKRNS